MLQYVIQPVFSIRHNKMVIVKKRSQRSSALFYSINARESYAKAYCSKSSGFAIQTSSNCVKATQMSWQGE